MNNSADHHKLKLLIRIINELSVVNETQDLISNLIKLTMEFTQADRGFLVEFKSDGSIQFYNFLGQVISDPKISLSTVNKVLESSEPVCLIENADGQSIPPTASILALDLKTIMCAPLTIASANSQLPFKAALYVDSQISTHPFSRQDLDFFTVIAQQASIVWQNIALNERLVNDFKLLHQEVRSKYDYHRIVGKCDQMKSVYELLEMLRETDLDVMITGDTGTGKELIAKAIHYSSKRSDASLVQLNCAALPEGLMEAELFGVEKNVATEVRRRSGRLELANDGTLFLDEIGDMPMHVQNRMLRFLEDRCFRRIGGRDEINVNVRILAATNKNLEKEIAAGRFRDALRYRLDIMTIHLPPLRERGNDLELLADFFLEEVVESNHLQIQGFTSRVWKVMREYSWPGNVRELKHRVHSAAFLAKGQLIDVEDLGLGHVIKENEIVPLNQQIKSLEINFIKKSLAKSKSDYNAAAFALGVSMDQLHKKIRDYGLTSIKD